MIVDPVPSIYINSFHYPSSNNICQGDQVEFIVHTNLYVPKSATYQWKNGQLNVGGNSRNFVTKNLADKDKISCILTTNEFCGITTTLNE